MPPNLDPLMLRILVGFVIAFAMLGWAWIACGRGQRFGMFMAGGIFISTFLLLLKELIAGMPFPSIILVEVFLLVLSIFPIRRFLRLKRLHR